MATKATTTSTTVRVSVAQGLIEISGSERFVAGQLASPVAVAGLWAIAEGSRAATDAALIALLKNEISAAEAAILAEEAKDGAQAARERFKHALRVIADHEARRQEAARSLNN